MNNEVSWQVELAVKPNMLDDFLALTREMVEYTKGEEGALIYERYISEDGRMVYVYERYTDSAAAVAHLQAFGEKFGKQFEDIVERKRFIVFGNANDTLRAVLNQFDIIYLEPLDGFSRL